MPLPRLTHLQFFVLSQLLSGAERGRDLRDRLRATGVRQSGPAFYQMMAGLEDRGLVEGRYEQSTTNGQVVRERHYRVLAPGNKAWHQCRDYYAGMLAGLPPELAHGS